MQHFAELLLGTVALRPYVFVFFACYLYLAISQIGLRRALLFTLVAYAISFLSEWSSAVAATGIPFGLYHYIDATSGRELWIAGVPFMDSLSFTFLSFVSWRVAVFSRCRRGKGRSELQVEEADRSSRSLRTTLQASFLMMCLDIIIDPVALRGDRWFLGKIYYYPQGGAYFGVTIANFAGWFLVCFIILRVYLLSERLIGEGSDRWRLGLSSRLQAVAAVGLYFGILGFNLFMTFWIGELLIGFVGVAIVVGLAALIYLSR